MAEEIKHECGIALIRLLKPLDFYREKYGTPFYGINKLYLLMQKQHNRGQDGAGIATIKLDPQPGTRYISRHRDNSSMPIKKLFNHVLEYFSKLPDDKKGDTAWLQENMPFMGELLLGHLRYGTFGLNSIESCHPFLRQNNWISRNLVLAGNFNLTNVSELFDELVELGQYPKERSDTVTILEKIGHFLDTEVQRVFDWFKADGYNQQEVTDLIIQHINIARILQHASKKFDGGYVMAGLIGHGDAFVLRDPIGIRPAYYHVNDEVAVVASERPAIQTAFNVPREEINELQPGHALIIRKTGQVEEALVNPPKPKRSCSFERIYFSRGTDHEIYKERKLLGRQLAKRVLASVDYDLDNTVFSFVPNTAETAFLGLMEGVDDWLNETKASKLLSPKKRSKKEITEILNQRPRIEKIAVKDAKLRTFITDDASRGELVSHVYDVTYGVIQRHQDNLVLLDDSIVRGTTLKQSIIKIAARLKPKQIFIISSAPQIRYPDCYGIDMSKLKEFVAFNAIIELLQENGRQTEIDEVYQLCKAQENLPKEQVVNHVQKLYNAFSIEEIEDKIAQLVSPPGIDIEVKVIYQTLEGLHSACPNHTGDWYFSGNFPTPGGNKVVNRSFINYFEGKDERAYF